MNVSCRCVFQSGSDLTLTQCLRFSLIRERYTPYATLHAQFLLPSILIQLPIEVVFSLKGKIIHDGFVQQANIVQEKGAYILKLYTKSYTAGMTSNQLRPGVYPEMTLAALMRTYDLEHISYEAGITEKIYIFVRENTMMWDAIVAYSFKLCSSYPFIRASNLLCVHPRSDPTLTSIPDDCIVSSGNGLDTSQILSRVEMADIDGNYGGYSRSDGLAETYGITRVRHIAFDKQYLDSPPDALRFRIACSKQRLKQRTVTYLGYCGEDIEDLVYATPIGTARVSRIVVSGDAKGIVTKDTFYYDPFCNTGS